MHLIGTLMLLLKGAIDFETRKHDSVVKCTTSLFFVLYGKAEMVSSSRLRVGGFHPHAFTRGAFRRGLVSIVHRAVINVSLFPVPRLKDEPQRRNIYDNDDES